MRQAASLADAADQFREFTGVPDILLMGDVNVSREDPTLVLDEAGYSDLGVAPSAIPLRDRFGPRDRGVVVTVESSVV